MHRLKPFVQRDVAELKNRTHTNRELLAALAALLQAKALTALAILHAGQNINLRVIAAVRANGAVRPKHFL